MPHRFKKHEEVCWDYLEVIQRIMWQGHLEEDPDFYVEDWIRPLSRALSSNKITKRPIDSRRNLE